MSRYLRIPRQRIRTTRIHSVEDTHLKNIYVNKRNAIELSTVDLSISEGIVVVTER